MATTNKSESPQGGTAQTVEARSAVLVVTDDSDDPGLAAARSTAGDLAAEAGVPVVLYDRSEETWGDTPHPEGPMNSDHPALAERDHLVAQMEELSQLGATPKAWVATLPSISAVGKAIAATSADVVVVAEDTSTRLLERALAGAGALGEASLAELILAQQDPRLDNKVTVVTVSADGAAVVAGRA